MIVESALPLKHISLVELITTERTGALTRKTEKNQTAVTQQQSKSHKRENTVNEYTQE